MELRDYAGAILEATELEARLLTDADAGPPRRLSAPGRSDRLKIRPAREVKVPGREGMADPAQRVRILHAFANHELQAVELFAWAILAFPESPGAFRRGLVRILAEEQDHLRLYLRLLARDRARLGDWPLSGYFWNKVESLVSPLEFVSAMALTFESANLDHASDYGKRAGRAGDEEAAEALARIHREEIGHVRFGWKWLNRFKRPGESAWEAWTRSLTWPLRPARAAGRSLDMAARKAAGIPPEFLARLQDSLAKERT